MNKNYKRGMKDGATPFEDKFKKQEEKFRQTEGELRQEQSKLDSFLDDLLDVSEEQDKRITNIEDKANYGFNDVIDIKDLEDKDKKFLAGILMATCKRIKKINQQQKDFILGVLKYIDIKEPDLNIPLENIENIESLQMQKAMLQVIMELMFIGEENFDFLNEYEDIFEYFSVNKKGFKDIKKSIQDMYDMVGIEWFYHKYEEKLLDEEDIQKNQEKEEEIEQKEIITKNLCHKFKIELESISKEKEHFSTNIIFKDIKEELKEKKDIYDLKVSKLFDFYNIENKNLFDDLDEIWDRCYKTTLKIEKSRLMLACLINGINIISNDRLLYESLVERYKKEVCIYCCKFVYDLINE